MILIRLDLPAPLSPRTQVTSWAPTLSEMPCSAGILPYSLPTSVISMRGVPFTAMPRLPPRRRLAHPQVGDGRQQQHDPQKRPEPVRVPPGVHDALRGHAEDEGADRR